MAEELFARFGISHRVGGNVASTDNGSFSFAFFRKGVVDRKASAASVLCPVLLLTNKWFHLKMGSVATAS